MLIKIFCTKLYANYNEILFSSEPFRFLFHLLFPMVFRHPEQSLQQLKGMEKYVVSKAI